MSTIVLVGARPRRGSNGLHEHQTTQEVEITGPVIQNLFHMRQADAARILGISLSSLKSACRRLGFPRWPYSRHRPTATHIDDKTDEEASGSTSAAGCSPASAPGCANSLQTLLPEFPRITYSPDRVRDREEVAMTTPCLHEAAGGDWEGERGIDTSWLERYMQSTDEDEV
ncbi:hypothetical protein GUITHDRAFT_105664 [Guillardia theta CCMP2712]|uniref:RWP-RK domain-containing protein n=1 Tax=Guillardia theta (strain CCMP2712) TaxID=905079 RepID=L1JK40_GUITC|nr:hypothetical protein GUITHDRAFT_105664 [Guillardia theta CCMP2712]EKX48519.1 hypothetical protein GUITHDRAFT_105664 [Guillardia theta CCMP2712]|eukprot:XP_005835499.1 hypothetical protein GUITHDRAFT_105664 [Guillardia theta CCMP2712]